jgi:D-alanyl-D-alanine dipeptidase
MRIRISLAAVLAFALLSAAPSLAASATDVMPDTFVRVEQVIPGVLLDIRYFSDHNFLGTRVDGYLAPTCILTRQAAQALAEVQKELAPFGMTLKIYDGYRPQRAVDHFVRWARDISSRTGILQAAQDTAGAVRWT